MAANVVAVLLGKGLVILIGLATVALLTRHLGPDGFGEYRIVLTFVSLVAIFAELGLFSTVLREISETGADRAGIVGAALTLRLTASAAVLLLGSLSALFLPYPTVVVHGIFIAAVYFVAFQAAALLNAVFQRHGRQQFQMAAELAGGLATVVLIGLGIALGLDVIGMVGATTAGGLVALIVALGLAGRLERIRLRIDPVLWRRLLIGGLPIAGSWIALMAIIRGDIVLISLLDTPSAVGLYGVPRKIFENVTGVTLVLAAMAMPKFAAALSHGDNATFRRHLRETVILLAVISGGFIAICLGFAEEILVVLAGVDFAPATPALVLIALATGAHALSQCFRFALTAQRRQRTFLVVDCAGLAVAIGAYLLLIPWLSYLGAAIATAGIELLLAAALATVLSRGSGSPIPSGLWKVGVAIAASALAAWGLKLAGLPWPLAMLLESLGYLALLLGLAVFPASQMRELLSRPAPG